jgi:hypothetical protein
MDGNKNSHRRDFILLFYWLIKIDGKILEHTSIGILRIFRQNDKGEILWTVKFYSDFNGTMLKKRGGMLQTWTSSTAIEKIEICPTNQCKKKLRPTLRSRITGARLTRGEANKPQDSSRRRNLERYRGKVARMAYSTLEAQKRQARG